MSTDRSHNLDVHNWRDLQTDDGAFAVDQDQEIVYWSANAERLLGHLAKDVVGKFCYEVLGGRDAENYSVCRPGCPVMANARRGRPTPDHDLLCMAPTGQDTRTNVTVAVARRNRNDFQVLHLFRDVNASRRIEEFARKASTTLHQLLNEADGDPAEIAEEVSVPLPKLSRRETQVLRLLAAGNSTQQIAGTLGVRPLTARNHVSRLLAKLGVDSRLKAVVYASRKRII
jgi:DNA-binding CsgD family transcriptional regulator